MNRMTLEDDLEPVPQGQTVLVMADFMFAARVQHALTQMGWTPRLVSTPEAALAALRETRPSLLMIELGAGIPARIDLLRALRADPATADLPVLAFGSHKARTMLQEARDAGATLVVSNGSLVSRFEELVRRSLQTSLTNAERLVTEDD